MPFRKRLIIVDDDEQIVYLTKTILSKKGYNVEDYTDPIKAYNAFIANPSLVFFTDLNMPQMMGDQLLAKLNQHETPPVVIVLTSVNDLDTVIKLMRHGAYDYMVKPFSIDELLTRTEKAFEMGDLKRMEKLVEKERELRIENQLNWNLWKESMIKKDVDKVEGNLIGNLNSSLVQGAGIGTMTTLIQMIQQFAEPTTEEKYLVPKDLMNMLFENAEISNHLTMMLGDIDYIINNPMSLEVISLETLHSLVEKEIESIRPFANKRKHSIKLGSNRGMVGSPHQVRVVEEYFRKVVRELVVNAMKFSLADTSIYVLFEIFKDNMHINFLSHPEPQNGILGISEEYSRLIFEPFFRISRTVHEEYETLDFGLGLTFVEKVIHQHQGKIRAQNLKNHIDVISEKLVCFSVELPFV